MKPHTTGCGQPQRVPAKVRLDGEAELTASLLAQFLLLAVLFAVLLALIHVRRLLVALWLLDLAFTRVSEAAAVDFGRRRRRRQRVAQAAGLLAFLRLLLAVDRLVLLALLDSVDARRRNAGRRRRGRR